MRRSSNDPVLDWLLDSDPSIRWQVMRDLTDTLAEIVAAERSRVASEGWGVRMLDQQRPERHWGDGVTTPLWWSNLYTLLFVRDLGLDPMSARADRHRSRSQQRHLGTRVRRLAFLSGVRSSRASTAASSRSAPASASAAIDSSIDC